MWTERVPNDDTVGVLLCHSNWFTTLIKGMIEERSVIGTPRQEYMDGVKEGRSYAVIKRLSTIRKKLQAYQPMG